MTTDDLAGRRETPPVPHAPAAPAPSPADPVVAGGAARPGSGYTATDDGLGSTADSVRTWQEQRGRFGTFVRAEVRGAAGAAGPPYPDRSGRAAHPTLVLVDELGRSLALNGTPAGFDGVGPRGAAQILASEGLLPPDRALAVVTARAELSLQRPVAPGPGRTVPGNDVPGSDVPGSEMPAAAGVLPDVVAQDPQALARWSAQQRWRERCSQVDPRLPDDLHYPALAAALERMSDTGVDVPGELAAATSRAGDGPLPEQHPGRALHGRLAAASPAAIAGALPPPEPGPSALSGPSQAPVARPAPARAAARR